MQENELLTLRETDRLLGLPRGRTLKLARRNLIPHVVIPAVGKAPGEIRCLRTDVQRWLASGCPPMATVVPDR